MGDRCTGHCCRQFWIGAGKRSRRKMLLTVARDQTEPGWEHAGVVAFMIHELEDTTNMWGEIALRCLNLGEDGSTCLVYEDRPDMCRNYPYGRKCDQEACDWDQVNELGKQRRRLLALLADRHNPSALRWQPRPEKLVRLRRKNDPADLSDMVGI